MDELKKMNNKISSTILLQLISCGVLTVTSIGMVVSGLTGNNGIFLNISLLGEVLSAVAMCLLGVRIKYLRTDRDERYECLKIIYVINNLISEIKSKIDINTIDGKRLADILATNEFSLKTLTNKMYKYSGYKLRFSIRFELIDILLNLKFYHELYCDNQEKENSTTKSKVTKNSYSKYLKILGLNENINDWNTIKSTYRKLCKKYHTDINNSSDALKKMQDINIAYSELEKQFS